MKILAIEKEVPGVTDEKFRPHLREEVAKGWEMLLLIFISRSELLIFLAIVQEILSVGRGATIIHHKFCGVLV